MSDLVKPMAEKLLERRNRARRASRAGGVPEELIVHGEQGHGAGEKLLEVLVMMAVMLAAMVVMVVMPSKLQCSVPDQTSVGARFWLLPLWECLL